jgi:hypothetical protein
MQMGWQSLATSPLAHCLYSLIRLADELDFYG